MSLELLIARYGLPAIFLGAAIEGETVVMIGGVLAHRHLMDFWMVALAACAGSFFADQILFFAGRHAREYRGIRKLIEKPAFRRATQLLERHPTGFIFAFRFLYGFRTISPVAIGMSGVPAMKFVMLNAVAASIWGPLFAALGYLFGQGIEQVLGRLPLERHVFIAIGTIALLFIIAGAIRKSRAV